MIFSRYLALALVVACLTLVATACNVGLDGTAVPPTSTPASPAEASVGESAGAPEGDRPFGTWVVYDFRLGEVAALDADQAQSLIGKTAVLEPAGILFQIAFDGRVCQVSAATVRTVAAADSLRDHYGTSSEAAGLPAGNVQVNTTDCANLAGFGEFITYSEPDPRLVINLDGGFFFLAPAAAVPVVTPGGELAAAPELTPTAQIAPESVVTEPAVSGPVVRTLLVAPGEPGPLYALLTTAVVASEPAANAQILVSQDFGAAWSPLPGELPVPEGCMHNISMDYYGSTFLFASTCEGIFRWNDEDVSWARISSEQVDRIAVIYGVPDAMWATRPFGTEGAPVIRSEDGGQSWRDASEGLAHFHGVANIGINPRDSQTVYAIIWPQDGGAHLRRRNPIVEWQDLPTPGPIATGMTIDGGSGHLYVTTTDGRLWRSTNATNYETSTVSWEQWHDLRPEFGAGVTLDLLASGWSPDPPGLAIYANVNGSLHRSRDGGETWESLAVSE